MDRELLAVPLLLQQLRNTVLPCSASFSIVMLKIEFTPVRNCDHHIFRNLSLIRRAEVCHFRTFPSPWVRSEVVGLDRSMHAYDYRQVLGCLIHALIAIFSTIQSKDGSTQSPSNG